VALRQAVVERLVGVTSIALPDRLDDFLAPSLLTMGIGLAVVAVLLATRPVVDRRRSGGRAAEARARDIVRRHGEGTLDYFALRSDKQCSSTATAWWPTPSTAASVWCRPTPLTERRARTGVGGLPPFRRQPGLGGGRHGASEQWLPLYRATGMHDIYIGDEAVVDVQGFSLAGGHMKGLRRPTTASPSTATRSPSTIRRASTGPPPSG